MPLNGFAAALAFIVDCASISAYLSRTTIWRQVVAIAFARIHAVRWPRSC
jgi:hypothetical protein